MTAWRQLSLLKDPRRQRGTRPRPARERDTHIMIADTLARWGDPDWECTHFPAGEMRTEETGALLKRMGTRPGWPDFLLLSPTGLLYGLELKSGNNPLTVAQARIRDSFSRKGNPYRVARGYTEALEILKGWGVVRDKVRVSA